LLVELGVWHGVSTSRLRRAMDPDGVLYAVDPYPSGRLGFSFPQFIARREVAKAGGGNVEWVPKSSLDAARDLHPVLGGRIQFLFIDAGHEYEDLQADWEAWSGFLIEGGVVALHDSRSSPKRNLDGVGSMIYTQQTIMRDQRFEFVEGVDSLTVMRRNAM
jgi:predicted O-methyltransferase YrrM